MRKLNFLTAILSLLITANLNAARVDESVAKTVANSFYKLSMKKNNFTNFQSEELSQINYRPNSIREPHYYIFGNKNCFIIVSGNDIISPIIAYSFDGTVDPNAKNDSFDWYLEAINEKLEKSANIQTPTAKIINEWNAYKEEKKLNNSFVLSGSDKFPLVKTKWSQSPYYNNLCPMYLPDTTKRPQAGCVALAMAQALKYYEWPNDGQYASDYYLDDYGSIIGNYAYPSFYWHLMPTKLDAYSSKNKIDASSLLIRNCGIIVQTMYGLDESGTYYFFNLPAYMSKYLSYTSDNVAFRYDSSANDSVWYAKIKNDLDNNRVIIYCGVSDIDAHAFICDGYQTNANNNEYYHFNWGWGGDDDGYFDLSNLSPDLHSLPYTSQQYMLTNLMPDSTRHKKISYNNFLSSRDLSVKNTESFNIDFTVSSQYSQESKGDLFTILLDSNYNFIQYISNLEDVSLDSNAKEFSIAIKNLEGIAAGKYYIANYFKPYQKGPQKIRDYNTNRDYFNVTILPSYHSDIKLKLNDNSTTNINGGTSPFEIDLPATYTELISYKNCSPDTFVTCFRKSLYDWNDSLISVRDLQNGSITSANSVERFIINEDPSELNLKAGRYKYSLQFRDEDLTWKDFDEAEYANPFFINIYDYRSFLNSEENYSESKAKALPCNFINDSALININQSYVCKQNTNYFSINLPKGSDCEASFRFIDEFSSNYTPNTSLISYSFRYNDNEWSQFYSGNQIVNAEFKDGGKLLIKVAPFIDLTNGTFSGKIKIINKNKTEVTDSRSLLKAFPNPSSGIFNINLNDKDLKSYKIINSLGESIEAVVIENNGAITIDLSKCANGMYYLILDYGNQIETIPLNLIKF